MVQTVVLVAAFASILSFLVFLAPLIIRAVRALAESTWRAAEQQRIANERAAWRPKLEDLLLSLETDYPPLLSEPAAERESDRSDGVNSQRDSSQSSGGAPESTEKQIARFEPAYPVDTIGLGDVSVFDFRPRQQPRLSLVLLRLNLEDRLRNLVNLADPGHHLRGARPMAQRLRALGVIDTGLEERILRVLEVANYAVHGDSPQPSDAVRIVPQAVPIMNHLNNLIDDFLLEDQPRQ